MAEIALGAIMLVGTAISTIGSIKAANAQADSMEYQAKRNDENAKLVFQQAHDDQVQAARGAAQVTGSIRAAYGASGLSMEGTPQAVLDSENAIARENQLKIAHGAALQAAAYQADAANLRSGAGDVRTAGWLGGIGQGLAGAASAGMKYMDMQSTDKRQPKRIP